MALGCLGTEADVTGTDLAEARVPEIGSLDRADRDCKVVLREVSRLSGATGGYETSCVTGPCWFVWTALVDVSRDTLPAGGVAYVLYRSTQDNLTLWNGARGAAIAGAAEG